MLAIDPSRLLTTVNPVLASQWHPTKNDHLSLETVYAGTSKKAWWLCPTCGYEWEAVVSSRNNGRGCSYCAGKVPNETNSLVSLHPEIAAQYSERNSKPVETLTRISHKKVWWQCSDNSEHEWEAMVQNRVRQGDGCPYCSGRYATKENNLAVKHPELVTEFNLVKNYPLTPYTATSSSSLKKFWWKCVKGHEWQNVRVKLGKVQNCPYCIGKKATHDNHLGVTNPEVAKQYHPTKNTVSVEVIRPGSTTKRWWQCQEGHQWEASVSSRTRIKGTGCPECSPTPRTSKIEIEIRKALEEANVLSGVQKTYNAFITTVENKSLSVDVLGISLGGKQVVVEYDSWWWHSGKGRKDSYNIPEHRDTVKTQALLDSGYTVIRIREARPDVTLPLLHIQHENLVQIAWDQTDGIPALIETIRINLL